MLWYFDFCPSWAVTDMFYQIQGQWLICSYSCIADIWQVGFHETGSLQGQGGMLGSAVMLGCLLGKHGLWCHYAIVPTPHDFLRTVSAVWFAWKGHFTVYNRMTSSKWLSSSGWKVSIHQSVSQSIHPGHNGSSITKDLQLNKFLIQRQNIIDEGWKWRSTGKWRALTSSSVPDPSVNLLLHCVLLEQHVSPNLEEPIETTLNRVGINCISATYKDVSQAKNKYMHQGLEKWKGKEKSSALHS